MARGNIISQKFDGVPRMQEGLHLIAKCLRRARGNGNIAWRPLIGAWELKSLLIIFESWYQLTVST